MLSRTSLKISMSNSRFSRAAKDSRITKINAMAYYFQVILFVVVVQGGSVNEILVCSHSNKGYRAALLVWCYYNNVQGVCNNFVICG